MHTFALIFVFIVPLVKTENCRISHQSTEEAWEKKLMTHLRTLPTTAPNDTINVFAQVILRSFSITSDEETIEAASNFVLSWKDVRLKWNPSEYQGISDVVYESYMFWEPDIELMNEVDYNEYEYHYGRCRLENSGLIFCAPKITQEAPCLTKVSNWPYDIQNCTLQIGLFTPSATINLIQSPLVIFLDGAEYSAAWTVMKVYRNHSQVNYQRSLCGKGAKIDITFLLQREGAGLGAIVVYPAIIMAILALSSFLFNVQDDMRKGILCFNLLCHFMFITEISDLIPKHSEDTPTILFFLRDSLLINMLLVILTIFLASLRRKIKPSPSWINMISDTVLNSKVSLFVWPRSKDVTKKISTEQQIILKQWADFSDVLNSLSLWLLIFVYFCFICMYIPRKVFVKPDLLKSLSMDDFS